MNNLRPVWLSEIIGENENQELVSAIVVEKSLSPYLIFSLFQLYFRNSVQFSFYSLLSLMFFVLSKSSFIRISLIEFISVMFQ